MSGRSGRDDHWERRARCSLLRRRRRKRRRLRSEALARLLRMLAVPDCALDGHRHGQPALWPSPSLERRPGTLRSRRWSDETKRDEQVGLVPRAKVKDGRRVRGRAEVVRVREEGLEGFCDRCGCGKGGRRRLDGCCRVNAAQQAKFALVTVHFGGQLDPTLLRDGEDLGEFRVRSEDGVVMMWSVVGLVEQRFGKEVQDDVDAGNRAVEGEGGAVST